METNILRQTYTHTHTGVAIIHTFALLLFSYKYPCAPKQRHILHYCNTRDSSSYGFMRSVKPCCRVNLRENRSLYWDIHQSHHCGLPVAATAHRDIRYWKLMEDLVTMETFLMMCLIWPDQQLQGFMHEGVIVSLVFIKNLWARIHKQSVSPVCQNFQSVSVNVKHCKEQIKCFTQNNE